MRIEILEEKENPLLNRKEIRFMVEYKGKTPVFGEVRNELIKVLNSDKRLTIIDSINSEFGSQTALGYAKVYKDEESMKVEHGYRIEKNLEGKKKKEKKPVEEKAEKPVEAEEESAEKPVEKKAGEEKPAEKPTETKAGEKAEEPKPEAEPKAEEPKPKEKVEESQPSGKVAETKVEEKPEKPAESKAEEKPAERPKEEKPAEVKDKPEEKKDG